MPKALAKATVTLNGSQKLLESNSIGADRSDVELQLLSQDRSEPVSVARSPEATTTATNTSMHSRNIEVPSPDDADTDDLSLQSTTPEDGDVAPAVYLARSRQRS